MGSKKILIINCLAAVSILGACGNNATDTTNNTSRGTANPQLNKVSYRDARYGTNVNYGTGSSYNMSKVSTNGLNLDGYNDDVRSFYHGYINNENLSNANGVYGTNRYPSSVNYYNGVGYNNVSDNDTGVIDDDSAETVNRMSEDEAKLAEKIKNKVEHVTNVQQALTFVTDKDVYIAVKSTDDSIDTIKSDIRDAVKGDVDNRHVHIGVGKSFITDIKKILTDLNDGKQLNNTNIKTNSTR